MIVILLQLLHVFALWRLEFFLYPELLIYPYLTAQKVLPYGQILDQHFPGLMFFPINFYSLGFTGPQAFKALLIIVVLLQSALIYKITKSSLSVLLFSLWQPLFEGNHLWLDSFLPLFLLPAYIFFQLENFVLAGLLLGIGVVFKQTLIPVVAYVGLVIIARKQFRNLLIFSICALLPSAIMLVYLYKIGVLSDFWYWTVEFNLTTFAAHGRNLPSVKELIKVFFIGLVAIYLFIKNPKTRHAVLFGLFASLETFSRFGLIHLQPLIPMLALSVPVRQNWSRTILVIVGLSLLWFGYFIVRQPNVGQYKYFDKETLELVTKVKARTNPGDSIFLLGVQPHLYEQTRTLPPGNVFVFQFPWFLQIAGGRVLQTLKDDPPKLVLYDPSSEIDEQHLNVYGGYLLEYIESRYKVVDSVGQVKIYESRN